jgi:hypothetical protein
MGRWASPRALEVGWSSHATARAELTDRVQALLHAGLSTNISRDSSSALTREIRTTYLSRCTEVPCSTDGRASR